MHVRNQRRRGRLTARHDGEVCGLARTLRVVDIERRPDIFGKPILAHVTDDADDVQRVQVAVHVAELNALAERLLVGEVLPGERLADDGDVFSVRRVGRAEGAPADDGDAHGREIVAARDAVLGFPFAGQRVLRQRLVIFEVMKLGFRRVGAVDDQELAVRAAAGQRYVADAAGSRDAGNVVDALKQLRVKLRHLLRVGLLQRDVHGHGAVGAKAGIDLQDAHEALAEQARADQ